MTTVIYGECIGANAREQVAISRLATDGCRVQPVAGDAVLDGDLDLWIGATGPFAIVALRDGAAGYAARFKLPLAPAIVAHFTA